MAPFLRGANPVFLKFIEDGLADMDRQNQTHGGSHSHNDAGSNHYLQANNPVSTLDNVLSDAGQAQKTPEYWAERLILLKVLIYTSYISYILLYFQYFIDV